MLRWLIGISVSLFFLLPFPMEGKDMKNELQEWLSVNRIDLKFSKSQKFSVKGQRLLDKLLAGKQMVYLGEPDHHIAEKYDYRLLFIKELTSRGFRRIGMEMGAADAERINRFVQTGDVVQLQKVNLYKNSWQKGGGDFASNRFAAAEVAFAQELRKISVALPKPIEYFGYDLDAAPGNAFDYFDEDFGNSTGPEVKHLAKMIEEGKNSSDLDAICKNFLKATKYLESHKRQLELGMSASRLVNLHMHLMVLSHSMKFQKDSAEFFKKFAANKSGMTADLSREFMVTMAEREKTTMFPLMDLKLKSIPQGEGVILMGHNIHLCKDSEKIVGRDTYDGKVDEYPIWKSIGTYLDRKYPNQILAVWMMYENGTHIPDDMSKPTSEVKSEPGTLEADFGKAGKSYMVSLDRDEIPNDLARERNLIINGYQRLSAKIADQADLVFFVRKVSAPKLPVKAPFAEWN